MVRVIFAAALIAVSMISFSPVAHASRTLDDVLARLEALEKENATLRKRVQRLEAADRERPVVASLPASAPAAPARTARSTPAVPSTATLTPAANQAYASITPPVEARNWTGLYLGASGGMRREDHTWTTNTFLGPPIGPVGQWPNSQDFNDTSARFGGFVGYNVQIGPKLVVGIEGDLAWGNTKTSTNYVIPGAGLGIFLAGPLAPNDTSEFKTEWDASLRGRVGALITPDTLAYLTGGVSWQRVKATATCDATTAFPGICVLASRSDTQSKTLTGWTLGAGIESTIANAWTGRLEYRYAQYSDFNALLMPTNCCDGNLNTTISLSTHTFIAGIAYKIGGY
jgi:outer membrane immunogenic protein